MSRRRRAVKRLVAPDLRFGSSELARFINKVMLKGKKITAQKIVYGAMDLVRQESRRDPLEIFNQALRNSTPLLQVKPRRVGGATYQIPTEVQPDRGQALGVRWLITSARSRRGMPMTRRLALEFMDAAKGDGAAVKRKEDLHRMAEANRAFVHYRW